MPEHQRFREQFDEQIRRKFGAERVSELLAKRRPNNLNDNSSIGPGIKVIFRDFKPEKNGTILEQNEACGITGTVPIEDMEGCYALELQEGGFEDEGGGIAIFRTVSSAGEIDQESWVTTVGWAFLLRIEGVNGELVQNLNHYLPDGRAVQ